MNKYFFNGKILCPEKRALELFAKGKTLLEVAEILFDEFPEFTETKILIEAESALVIHKEKSIPDENKTNN